MASIDLRRRWLGLWVRSGIALSNPAARRWAEEKFEDIYRHYDEPHRRYHTLEHIAQLLEISELARGYITFPVEFELALILHDVIYEVSTSLAAFNETRSRQYMCELVEESRRFTHFFFEKGRIPRTGSYIMAANHSGKLIDRQKQLIADIDLTPLGAPWERYVKQGKAIRFEFQNKPEQRYQTDRVEFLRKMLARRHIYYTEVFEKYETQARKNMERELDLLGGSRA